jgi:hypothetical protein
MILLIADSRRTDVAPARSNDSEFTFASTPTLLWRRLWRASAILSCPAFNARGAIKRIVLATVLFLGGVVFVRAETSHWSSKNAAQ